MWVKATHVTVDTRVVCAESDTTILFTNFALPRHPIETALLKVTLNNAVAPLQATILHIDQEHANAIHRWQNMGEHEYLSAAERP